MAKLPDGYVFIVEPHRIEHRIEITLGQHDLVMCRNCSFHRTGENEVDAWSDCCLHNIHVSDNDWCSWAVKREVSVDA